jgi:hypothetical protein
MIVPIVGVKIVIAKVPVIPKRVKFIRKPVAFVSCVRTGMPINRSVRANNRPSTIASRGTKIVGKRSRAVNAKRF